MKGIGVHRGSGGVKNIRNKCKSLTSDKNPWFKNGYCGKKNNWRISKVGEQKSDIENQRIYRYS